MREEVHQLLNTIRLALWSVGLSLVLMFLFVLLLCFPYVPSPEQSDAPKQETVNTWIPPDSTKIPATPEGDLIRYGRELIAHTAIYLGPQGTISAQSNGMNCQNCHLKAGKKTWGNNYSTVASLYPKFRARSGTVEQIEKRVNDCLERSLNGRLLREDSREMKSIVAYIRWVGSEVPSGHVTEGAGLAELPFLKRPADPEKGKMVYAVQCVRCHGEDGQGTMNAAGNEWLYPPLWGNSSFNTGAGILRISRMAGFIYKNMPNDTKTRETVLSEEEAWDLAAFICSQPRPAMDTSHDWPDVSSKPFDHPFGPYADKFSETQHRYGPFEPILAVERKK